MLYLSYLWTNFDEFLHVEIFWFTKHAKFQQGCKGHKAKGYKAIKARCKDFLNKILEHFRHLYVHCSHFLCTYYR